MKILFLILFSKLGIRRRSIGHEMSRVKEGSRLDIGKYSLSRRTITERNNFSKCIRV